LPFAIILFARAKKITLCAKNILADNSAKTPLTAIYIGGN